MFCHLTPTNDASLTINNEVLSKLPVKVKEHLSADKALCDEEQDANNYPIEFLNKLTPPGMPPHKLMLKPNCIVMLLRNLDIKRGLCNGTRLRVNRLHNYVLDAEVLTGSNKGARVLLPRIRLAPSDPNQPFTLQRTQFSIRLSYCLTINKIVG